MTDTTPAAPPDDLGGTELAGEHPDEPEVEEQPHPDQPAPAAGIAMTAEAAAAPDEPAAS